MQGIALGNQVGLKGLGVIAENAPGFGQMNLKPRAFGHCVFPGPAEADDCIHDVLFGAGAALVARLSGMVNQENGDAPATKIQKPRLHGLPRLRFVFLARAAECCDIVQHNHVHAFQKRLNHGLPVGRGQIRHGARLQVRRDE